ncbi:MAG: hypothetical protein QHC90_13165 [Shinella sp.]|nr:hypothetical protein [Shinella sp.]
MAQLASLLLPTMQVPQRDMSWLNNVFGTVGGAIDTASQNKSFGRLADLIGEEPAPSSNAALLASSPNPPPQSVTGSAPVMPVERGAPQGSTYQQFIETVRSRVNNPYALSAIAATGRAESGWSGDNAGRTWSDPSQSGQAGTSGGSLSWRGPRLASLQSYAASKGEQGNGSPQTQAEFFLQENPQLIQSLNNAKSPQEAADIMANAWRFAGYDNPGGGEAARRRALAQNYYAQEFGRGNAASSAINSVSPGGNGSPLSDASFDDRFGQTLLPSEELEGREALATALAESNAPRPAVSSEGSRPQVDSTIATGSTFEGTPAVTPVQRGERTNEIIQFMLRDPNLREYGMKLWQQTVTGSTGEPWQFVQTKDGSLLRANQQTGEVTTIGNFGPQVSAEGGDEWGLNTVWGKDSQGRTVIGQVSKSGKFKPLDTGDFVPTPGISNTDLGTSVLTRNNRTGEVIDQRGKDLRGAEREKEIGTSEGKAISSASGDAQAAQNALDLIDSLRNDPNREWGTGVSSVFNSLPGSPGFDFQQKVNQATSGAFLTAIQQMRGLGALSNAEGQTATAAVTRMNTASSEREFLAALADYESIVRQGLERAQRRMGVNSGDDVPPGIDPEDWEFMSPEDRRLFQ